LPGASEQGDRTAGPAAKPSFFVASRGHHADIGGITPGSMPPFSTTIAEEGVLLDNVLLVRDGRLLEAELLALLQGGPYPARNPQQTLADLRAQIAANQKGVDELQAMVSQFGAETVAAYMQHVQDNAEETVRRVITRLKDGAFTLPLDNGAQICVRVSVRAAQREATIDFTGTSAQLPNNFNAPKAVTMAAGGGARGLHAQPVAAGGGGGRQRGDQHLRHQRAVRRAGRDGCRPVHDEQLHLRQRHPPVLRDDQRRQRCGRPAGRARPGDRRLRRHQRRADAHDQFAPH
jgi:hypothetical protein